MPPWRAPPPMGEGNKARTVRKSDGTVRKSDGHRSEPVRASMAQVEFWISSSEKFCSNPYDFYETFLSNRSEIVVFCDKKGAVEAGRRRGKRIGKTQMMNDFEFSRREEHGVGEVINKSNGTLEQGAVHLVGPFQAVSF